MLIFRKRGLWKWMKSGRMPSNLLTQLPENMPLSLWERGWGEGFAKNDACGEKPER
jgi:hypothetical protein